MSIVIFKSASISYLNDNHDMHQGRLLRGEAISATYMKIQIVNTIGMFQPFAKKVQPRHPHISMPIRKLTLCTVIDNKHGEMSSTSAVALSLLSSN
jgi:hypothetical protein